VNDPALFELQFADSELLAPRWEDGTLVLVFAAAVVRPLASAPGGRLGQGAGLGQGSGLGHVRGLALQLTDARVTGDIASAFGRLADGRWQAQGQPPQRTLSVPQTVDQPVRLSLAWANGTALDLQATALRAVFSGTPGYRDSLAC
jgi:hypothetical protein